MSHALPAATILTLLCVVPPAVARQAASSCDAPAIASGRYIDIEVPIPGAEWINLRAINERGDIVGEFGGGSAPQLQSFLLRGGDVTIIAVPGATATRATGVNASGSVVGVYWDAVSGPHAFTWARGSFTLWPASTGMRSLSFGAINASGAIAGSYGVDPLGERPFVAAGLAWPTATGCVYGDRQMEPRG
jgi:probable HAF family extracellular repeat protein